MIAEQPSFSAQAAKSNAQDAPPEPVIDTAKWGKQLHNVQWAMRDGKWMTLAEVAFYACCPEASGSARIRDLARLGGAA